MLKLEHDWFPAALPASVRMGSRSWVYSSFSCVHLRSLKPDAVTIGDDSGVYSGTAFDLGPAGEVQIGKYCTIVAAIFSVNSRVEIGDFSFVAHEVVFADSPFPVPSDARRHEGRLEAEPSITLGPNCWVGARAILLAGTHLGEGVIVGAGAVVDCTVPAFSTVAGNPARIITPGSKAR